MHDLGITNEWRDQKPLWGHPFHQMCSYMAMFPASIPHYFIDRFTREGDLVLDPMCGRGTTPTQAVAEGRVGIGNDRNPLAYLLGHIREIQETVLVEEVPYRPQLDDVHAPGLNSRGDLGL